MQITTKAEKETFALAKNMARTLKGGDIIGLIGGLGAGKTVFTQGLANGLGVKDMVNSPTFVIMKIYDCYKHKSITKLVHIDAYRINSERDLEAIGAAEYFGKKDVITVIEWADKVKKILPKNIIFINITDKDNKRIFNFCK